MLFRSNESRGKPTTLAPLALRPVISGGLLILRPGCHRAARRALDPIALRPALSDGLPKSAAGLSSPPRPLGQTAALDPIALRPTLSGGLPEWSKLKKIFARTMRLIHPPGPVPLPGEAPHPNGPSVRTRISDRHPSFPHSTAWAFGLSRAAAGIAAFQVWKAAKWVPLRRLSMASAHPHHTPFSSPCQQGGGAYLTKIFLSRGDRISRPRPR